MRYCSLGIKYNHEKCPNTDKPVCCVGCENICDMECESAWFFSEDETCHHSISEKLYIAISVQETISKTKKY